jgi:D-alanyl-D-alanine carboxypeptidase (penicillin-binding protein 5/6)
LVASLLALAVVAPATAVSAAPGRGQSLPPTTGKPLPLPPRAWMLVDADTGAVISAGNERQALPPASLTKVLTALVAVHLLKPGTDIPISARAEATPATKINMKAGQTWTLDDALHALLMSSANDAAVALAERASGTVEAFQADLNDEARRLNMADAPVLLDPAGLDDSFSVGGGNQMSARDLAIAGRALLADPDLAVIVAENIARFTGGDGIAHRLLNHNNLLRSYPGAVGMKTGWTVKAGHCLIAAARRDGRTMLSVVMGAADAYGSSAALLDRGFATPARTEATLPHLPPVPTDGGKATRPAQADVSGAAVVTAPAQVAASHGGRWGNLLINVIGGIALALAVLRARVRLVRRRRRRALLGHVPARAPKPGPKPKPKPVAKPKPGPKPKPVVKPKPAPQPAPVAAPVPPGQLLWEGRTLEEWDRPLVSQP